MVSKVREREMREARDPAFLHMRRVIWQRYASKPEMQIKIKARAKLKHLVRKGKVHRGDCEGCGKPNAEAHHEDYSQPLDVRWLCRSCHVALHYA